jgi:hypothetical protein
MENQGKDGACTKEAGVRWIDNIHNSVAGVDVVGRRSIVIVIRSGSIRVAIVIVIIILIIVDESPSNRPELRTPTGRVRGSKAPIGRGEILHALPEFGACIEIPNDEETQVGRHVKRNQNVSDLPAKAEEREGGERGGEERKLAKVIYIEKERARKRQKRAR